MEYISGTKSSRAKFSVLKVIQIDENEIAYFI